MSSSRTLFIVGAGFSKGAGLPLASDFTKELLDVSSLKVGGPSRGLVELIRHFVDAAFAHKPSAAARYWPELEDLFTTIDLSANSGHHLGKTYSPADLRAVRRALLIRIIRMLSQRYRAAKGRADPAWKQLETFFERVDPANSAFLSMNWDTVIEQGLDQAHNIRRIDYGCGAIAKTFVSGELEPGPSTGSQVQVLKPHGSINWLYCDACRHVFSTPPSSTSRVADQLLRPRDVAVVKSKINTVMKTTPSVTCPDCEADALGTRIATFSFRKALDFPMHARTWQTAESLLHSARNWVFIGYSLPPADYEFKYMLKRVQLSRKTPPNIILVTGGAADAAEQTRLTYQKFFGPKLSLKGGRVFLDGLSAATLDGLSSLKCLNEDSD